MQGLWGSAAGRFELRRGDGVWGRPCRQQRGPRIRARGTGPGPTNVALPRDGLSTDGYGDMKSQFPAPEITLRAAPKRPRNRWGRRKRASLAAARGARGVGRPRHARREHLRPLLLLDAPSSSATSARSRSSINAAFFIAVVHQPMQGRYWRTTVPALQCRKLGSTTGAHLRWASRSSGPPNSTKKPPTPSPETSRLNEVKAPPHDGTPRSYAHTVQPPAHGCRPPSRSSRCPRTPGRGALLLRYSSNCGLTNASAGLRRLAPSVCSAWEAPSRHARRLQNQLGAR